MNPYILMPQQVQDTSGLQAVYQNTAAQDAMRNAAIAQGNQMTADAGRTTGGSGFSPMALAQALRKDKNPQDMNAKDAQMGGIGTYNPYTQYQVSTTYGTDPYSQQSRMLAAQEF